MTRERTTNDLCTPTWIIDAIVEWFGEVDLDPCSNEWSSVDAFKTYSIDRGDDGLHLPWVGGVVFENPPYGRGHLMPWAMKADHEAHIGSCVNLISLVPTSPSTQWFQLRQSFASARCDLSKRVRFDGGGHGGGTFDSTLFYAGPSPYLFAHAFQDHGDVRVFR